MYAVIFNKTFSSRLSGRKNRFISRNNLFSRLALDIIYDFVLNPIGNNLKKISFIKYSIRLEKYFSNYFYLYFFLLIIYISLTLSIFIYLFLISD